MLDIKKRFCVLTGLSDNMGGIESPVLAAALGASVIEKHLVLKHGKELDDRFSLDKNEFKKMVEEIRLKESSKGKIAFSKREKMMIGRVSYGPQTGEERYNKNFRRSLFVAKDIQKGEKFTLKNVRSVRPGYGLPPKDLEKLLGKKAKRDLKFGTPLSWKLIA
jgi:sialic acid synthase SpsE